MLSSFKWYVVFIAIVSCSKAQPQVPDGFVDVQSVDPEIAVELRYYSTNNFIGGPITGYENSKLIISKEAAEALNKVQNQLKKDGLGLKIFDGYRPQRAVNQFVEWAKDLGDTLMKAQYYPNVPKELLFEKGYIASRSGHSRGSTLDLTLISLDSNKELDMGSPYDLFDPISHDGTSLISESQTANRSVLKQAMGAAGFKSYQYEWWHFTLADEPYPDTYFDFAIR